MKTLLIIRHAKAETVLSLNDFERKLNERGRKDAPVMAKRIFDRKIKIDAFLSSPAKRAKKTAALFCEVYGREEKELTLISALYQAPSSTFFEVVSGLDDRLNTVALFAHNPGITYFANELSAAVQIDNMPTCGVFAVKADCKHWKDFIKAKKEFLFFDFPKSQ